MYRETNLVFGLFDGLFSLEGHGQLPLGLVARLFVISKHSDDGIAPRNLCRCRGFCAVSLGLRFGQLARALDLEVRRHALQLLGQRLVRCHGLGGGALFCAYLSPQRLAFLL
jgi:hypothetical protein